MMTKQRKNSGFTLAEMLIVVAITIILMGVAFIAVQNHQRSMTRLEFDSIAKEIFVAAQNHLTAAQSQGYLQAEKRKLGIDHTADGSDVDEYIIYKDPDGFTETILDLLLPFGSLDETVRAGGSYVIRYQPSSGRVLEVFYSLQGKSSLLTISGKTLTAAEDDYDSKLKPCAGDDAQAKRGRENYSGGVIGWYGGEEGLERGEELKAPEIKVFNEETLRVEVTDHNAGTGSLKLIITGAVSGAQKAFDLRDNSDARIEAGEVTGTVNVTLDDITQSGFHFAELSAENGKSFIPGENVIIEAVAFDNSKLTNIAYSGKKTTNSLFADISEQSVTEDGTPITNYTAVIENFRHFENLDKTVSKFEHDKCYEDKDGKVKTINKAEQVKDLLWKGEDAGDVKSFLGVFHGSAQIYAAGEAGGESTAITKKDCLCPVDLDYKLTYDGKSHKVSLVDVEHTEAAGLFGNVSIAGSQIENLELIDFEITSTSGNAGALVGTATNTKITNVLAHNSIDETTKQEKLTKNIEATGSAGGLVGKTVGSTTVQFSAASLIVNGTTVAGGLIGDAAGTINGCYSGGHTKNGSYEEWVSANDHRYDVIGATAGGLVGTSTATITNSYSTCSVSGSTTAGGFAGSASGTITNCYATGLLSTEYIDSKDNREKNKSKGAFAGTFSGNASDCKYYMIINEIKMSETKNGEKVYSLDHYLGAVGDKESTNGITALDLNAYTYNSFTGLFSDWNPAKPYDLTSGTIIGLDTYYSGKYTLKTVDELATNLPQNYTSWDELLSTTHYGDWPSPEVFFINQTS